MTELIRTRCKEGQLVITEEYVRVEMEIPLMGTNQKTLYRPRSPAWRARWWPLDHGLWRRYQPGLSRAGSRAAGGRFRQAESRPGDCRPVAASPALVRISLSRLTHAKKPEATGGADVPVAS